MLQAGARHCWMLAVMALVTTASAHATDFDPIGEITVVSTGISNMGAASAGEVTREQLDSQPLLRPAALLENVPGLIVTQHSGEGKANQYFLRAFNLDHGTDLAIEVDDMPVNMPTHAHGQGYSDLNFLIPELAGDLYYKKGPYYADEGDFATAGAVRIGLSNTLPSSASLGLGEEGYRRGLLAGSTPWQGGTLIGAAEAYHNDGPFDVPDDYKRFNGLLRYFHGDERDFFTLTAMGYSGKWNSTDQVPDRAIADQQIDRFGSLNSTDGGISERESLSFTRVRRTDSDQVQFSAYVIRYRLNLFSTFTYFLKDPINGDQMLQHDDRMVYGFKGSKTWYSALFGLPTTSVIGVQGRVDDIKDVGIFSTVERRILSATQDAAAVEASVAVYAENTIWWTDKVQTTIGVREDEFDFDVRDKMLNADGSCNLLSDPEGCVGGVRRAHIFSPKIGLVLGPWAKTTFFVNVGDGYHSNDARGITRSGANSDVRPVTPLTRAVSAEVGVKTLAVPDLESSVDIFLLKLKSELVFDGDAGVTEPSGATTRAGIELRELYHINTWLSTELNAAFTRARFDSDSLRDDLGCGDAAASHPCASPINIAGRYVPNSPTSVVEAAVTAHRPSGWLGSLRLRHFGSAPLVEDNSAKSPQYTTIDAQVGYSLSTRWKASVDVFNIANTRWNDIEYYYVTRLKNEAAPAAGYVVHPGVPRLVRANFSYYF
jgi:TonB dependent receptor/TonB-dependent Receptor Plug Domain